MNYIFVLIMYILLYIFIINKKYIQIDCLTLSNNSMKLDCVLTSVNNNPLYIDFIPIFIKTWKKLYPSVDVKIILIANRIPTKFKKYNKNIILFKPFDNISSSFISQYIRLLYPAILNYNNGILITDIDMLPMNRTYFTKHITKYTDNYFICMRSLNINNQYPICYNIATNKIWSEIFNIKSIKDIKNRLKQVFTKHTYLEGHGNLGWSLDQLHLYNYITIWNQKTNKFIELKDQKTKFKRLDRSNNTLILNDHIINNIKNGEYSDYHVCRPHKKFEDLNNKIYELL